MLQRRDACITSLNTWQQYARLIVLTSPMIFTPNPSVIKPLYCIFSNILVRQSLFLHTFARRWLSRLLTFEKFARSVMLLFVSWNVGNFNWENKDGIVVLTRIAWAATHLFSRVFLRPQRRNGHADPALFRFYFFAPLGFGEQFPLVLWKNKWTKNSAGTFLFFTAWRSQTPTLP